MMRKHRVAHNAIPWQEFVKTYNRMHKTEFKTPQEMLKALYDQHETLDKVGDIIGISGWTVGVYMRKWGLPKKPKGHRGNAPLQVAFRKIKDPSRYTHRELARTLQCSEGYINSLKRQHLNHGE